MICKPFRINKGLLALATLSAVFLLGTPQSASALLCIFLQEDGGAVVNVGSVANFTSVSATGFFLGNTFTPGLVAPVGGADFKIQIQGASSDNGTPGTDLLSSANSVENISATTAAGAATHILHLWASQTDYTTPTGTPLSTESSLGGSINTPTLTLANIFQVWDNNSNGQRDIVGAFTPGLQTALQTGSSYDTGSLVGTFPRTTSTSTYSMTQEANIELTAGGKINFSAHENKTAATPEPATTAMVLGGLPVLGLFWVRRRRQQS